MKKLFKYIGILSLVLASFIITEKTSMVIKETDDIMIKIKEEKTKFEQDPIDAKIEENRIIPGIYGKKVNEEKTYEQMKRQGKYNNENYVYDQTKPKISIEDIYDKYIETGNKSKKEISIIIIVKDVNMCTQELKGTKVTILKSNEIKNKNNRFTEVDIEKNINKIPNYCYVQEYDKQEIEKCSKEQKHTVKINKINKNLLQETKKELSNGKIITIELNDQTKKELKLTINYIKNKGFKIVKIEELLSEKNTN